MRKNLTAENAKFAEKKTTYKITSPPPSNSQSTSPLFFISSGLLSDKMVESAIGAHLINTAITGGFEVFYWREKNDELDFIITKEKKIIGIEVKTNSRFKISGAKSFQKNFKPHKLLLIGDAGINWQDFLKMNPSDLF